MSRTAKSSLHGRSTLNANGRIVIPTEIRSQLGLKAGDTLLLDVEDGALRIESYPARIRRIQREFSKYAKPGVLTSGVLASDELIAERREEVRREKEEAERDLHPERSEKAS